MNSPGRKEGRKCQEHACVRQLLCPFLLDLAEYLYCLQLKQGTEFKFVPHLSAIDSVCNWLLTNGRINLCSAWRRDFTEINGYVLLEFIEIKAVSTIYSFSIDLFLLENGTLQPPNQFSWVSTNQDQWSNLSEHGTSKEPLHPLIRLHSSVPLKQHDLESLILIWFTSKEGTIIWRFTKGIVVPFWRFW